MLHYLPQHRLCSRLIPTPQRHRHSAKQHQADDRVVRNSNVPSASLSFNRPTVQESPRLCAQSVPPTSDLADTYTASFFLSPSRLQTTTLFSARVLVDVRSLSLSLSFFCDKHLLRDFGLFDRQITDTIPGNAGGRKSSSQGVRGVMRLPQVFVSVLVASFGFSADVKAHSKARNPLNYLALVENTRIETPSQRVHAFSKFDLTFDLHSGQQHIKLSLEPNHDIIPADANIQYLDADGNVKHVEKLDREAHKVFQGTSWVLQNGGLWSNVGWARIVVRRDGSDPLFEGAFTVMGDHHHVQMKSNYMATKHNLDPLIEEHDDEYMTVFRDSDIGQGPKADLKKRQNEQACRADLLSFNNNPQHPVRRAVLKRDMGSWGSMSLASLLGKRQIDSTSGSGNSAGVNLKSTIGSTSGCPTTRKVALIGVATDCTYTAAFNSTDSVRQNVITQINSASDLYQSSFNITLGLQSLFVSDAECPTTAPDSAPWNLDCSGNTTITDRLNLFSAWRGERNDSNAYWTLMSTCNTGAEVGLAWLGQLCTRGVTTSEDESVAGANVVVRTSTEWQVIAHESGHTFGAVHDCDSDTCADSSIVNSQQCCPLSSSTCDADAQYIMNPSSTPGVTTFSPCTIGNICSAMGRNSVNSTCLSDNKGVTTITGNQCGNGIVEDGEECDCGGTDGCGDDSCCDASTCKFRSGAVCDDSNDACCSGCQFASADTVCRSSTGECDPQEVCSGSSASCPSDTTSPDGTKCGNSTSGLECASGQCTSRDLQCMTVMGSYTSNNDTYACNSQTCTLSCASPEFGVGVCYSMQQNFLDGTPCAGGGKCENGNCKGATVGGEVKSWISDHKTLVIAIAAVAGGFLLLSLLGCFWRRCIRPAPKPQRRRHHRPKNTAPPAWDGPMPPPMQQRAWGPSDPSWQPQGEQDFGWRPPPQGPPPAYSYPGHGSTRYA